MCLNEEPPRITEATVANHRQPHKGDKRLFYDATNLESLCKRHHDGDVQSMERKGYSDRIGPDGWPVDPAHPSNRPGGTIKPPKRSS
jgi:hypothetical protein